MRAGVTQKPARECSEWLCTAAQGRSQPRRPSAGERVDRRARRKGVSLGLKPGRSPDTPWRASVESVLLGGEAGAGFRARRGAGGAQGVLVGK